MATYAEKFKNGVSDVTNGFKKACGLGNEKEPEEPESESAGKRKLVEPKDFYESHPGYKAQMTRKKKTKFAEEKTTAQKIQEILDEFPGHCFDKDIMIEREAHRNAINGRLKNEMKRHDDLVFALTKENELLEELEEADNNMRVLLFGANLTNNLLNRKQVRAANKAKRAADRHARNQAYVEAPKRKRRVYVDDEALEVSPADAQAEDDAISAEGEDAPTDGEGEQENAR